MMRTAIPLKPVSAESVILRKTKNAIGILPLSTAPTLGVTHIDTLVNWMFDSTTRKAMFETKTTPPPLSHYYL